MPQVVSLLNVPHAARAPWGAPVDGLHVPTWPATSHAWHWPVQVVSQQTPSTTIPDAHWFAPVAAVPLTYLVTQLDPLQNALVAQLASLVHDVAQSGAQTFATPPAPHWSGLVQLPQLS